MNISAETGKVISASNTLITETSGSIQISSTVGAMHQGTGFIAGGGGSRSVSTRRTNVEKLRIAKFTSGEVNVQLECQPVFSVGHVVTIVKRGNHPLAYHNQTTGGWFRYRLGLTLGQMGVVLGAMMLLTHILWKTFWSYWDSSMSQGYFFFPDFVVEIAVLGFYVALTAGLTLWLIRFVRAKRKAVYDGVMAVIGAEAASTPARRMASSSWAARNCRSPSRFGGVSSASSARPAAAISANAVRAAAVKNSARAANTAKPNAADQRRRARRLHRAQGRDRRSPRPQPNRITTGCFPRTLVLALATAITSRLRMRMTAASGGKAIVKPQRRKKVSSSFRVGLEALGTPFRA